MTKPFNDRSLLSQEDQDAIVAKARETLDKETRDEAEKRFLEKALQEERRARNINPRNEPLVDIHIDLPGFAHALVVNNTHYLHGQTYRVTTSQAADMQSMMARAWEHEEDVGGANRNEYRKPKHSVIRPGM